MREWKRDLSSGELYPTDNGAGYYSDHPDLKRHARMTQHQVEEAYLLMRDEGMIDPSDFIDANRPGASSPANNGWSGRSSTVATGAQPVSGDMTHSVRSDAGIADDRDRNFDAALRVFPVTTRLIEPGLNEPQSDFDYQRARDDLRARQIRQETQRVWQPRLRQNRPTEAKRGDSATNKTARDEVDAVTAPPAQRMFDRLRNLLRSLADALTDLLKLNKPTDSLSASRRATPFQQSK